MRRVCVLYRNLSLTRKLGEITVFVWALILCAEVILPLLDGSRLARVLRDRLLVSDPFREKRP